MDDRKKILFVITHLALGGAQKHLLNLIESVDPKKYCCHLVSSTAGYLGREFVQIPGLTIHLIPQLQRNIHPISDLIAFIKIYRYIKTHHFDIIHTHSPKASFLSRWAGRWAGVKKIFYTVHGWPFHRFMNPLLYAGYLFLEKISAPLTTRIITVSRSDFKTALIKKISREPKLTLIHCGVDIDLCNDTFSQRNQTPRAPVVITVSALKKQKGLFSFLTMAKEVLRAFPETQFYIIGDGPLYRKIAARIKKLGLEKNVFLAGWRDDLSFFYRITSLFVLTSLWEGLPLALIEAVLCGIPVLVTDTGGIHDIVKNNEQGKIVAICRAGTLTAECEEMLRDSDQWNIISAEGREKIPIEYWSQKRSHVQIKDLYETSPV